MSRNSDEPTTPEGGGYRCIRGDGAGDAARRTRGADARRHRGGGGRDRRHARLAESPRAAVRNLAYLQNDLADPVLRRHVLRLARAARARYEQLLADALVAGELRAGTDVRALARMIEVTLGGSFLAWTIYREGPAARHLREDLDATLRPYLTRGVEWAG